MRGRAMSQPITPPAADARLGTHAEATGRDVHESGEGHRSRHRASPRGGAARSGPLSAWRQALVASATYARGEFR